MKYISTLQNLIDRLNAVLIRVHLKESAICCVFINILAAELELQR
jgi:hypothetical protein